MFGRKNCRKESTAWSERRVDRVAGDTKFVICYSSSVGEVVRLMWAVRHCIVRGYLTARSLCGRNSTFKHFFTHIAYLQCRSYAASQIQITNFWLKYYNCLKSVLYCLLKPVFFHHAVLYTSQNITLRPDYFDQEDELAFLGNILFVPVMQLVKFSGPSTQHNTHTHTTHTTHTHTHHTHHTHTHPTHTHTHHTHHTHTHSIHRMTQVIWKQCGPCPVFCELYSDICLTTEEKARKNLI